MSRMDRREIAEAFGRSLSLDDGLSGVRFVEALLTEPVRWPYMARSADDDGTVRLTIGGPGEKYEITIAEHHPND